MFFVLLCACMHQNYEALGLTLDLNVKEAIASAVDADPEAVEFASVADFTKQAIEGESKRPRNYVSEEETLYLDRLMKAHGSNYKAMERDIKRNNMQVGTSSVCHSRRWFPFPIRYHFSSFPSVYVCSTRQSTWRQESAVWFGIASRSAALALASARP
jgi:hypothetical protein